MPPTRIEEAGPADRARRASPLTPDERRESIVVAAIPLLLARGPAVTTRKLADAAGVAEGTLFRVFVDKEALIRAAVERALDPVPVMGRLAGIDTSAGLRATLLGAVSVLQSHSGDVAVLLSVSHELAGGRSPHGPHGVPPHGAHGGPAHERGHHPVEMVVRTVAGLLHPHAERLRLDPVVCARMLVGIVIATTRPISAGTAPALTPEQIVALFLDGALDRPELTEDPC